MENFERAKKKCNPLKTIDVTQPTITFDELHMRYKEVKQENQPSS